MCLTSSCLLLVKYMLCIQTSSWVLLLVHTLYLITIGGWTLSGFIDCLQPKNILFCFFCTATKLQILFLWIANWWSGFGSRSEHRIQIAEFSLYHTTDDVMLRQRQGKALLLNALWMTFFTTLWPLLKHHKPSLMRWLIMITTGH